MDETAPTRMRRTLDERLADLALRQRQLEARRAALIAAKRGETRKRDTRRKIIVGAVVLAEAERDPVFAGQLRRLLDQAVRKADERAAIADLLEAASVAAESG